MLNGDFFKAKSVLSDEDVAMLRAYNAEIERGINPQMAYYTTMQDASDAAANMASAARGAAVDIAAIPKVSKAAELGLKALSVASNMLLSIGISMAISALAKGVDYLIHRQEKLKEALDESVNKFSTATEELKSLEDKVETTSQKIVELQKLADNGSISISGEAELNTLKKTNKELARKVSLKQQEQAQNARQVLKDSGKNANSKIQSKYKGHYNSSGERFDYENITPDEELEEAIKAYTSYFNNAEKFAGTNMEGWYNDQAEAAKNRIEEMYGLISPSIEAYEKLIEVGVELSGADKVRYEQLKTAQDSYAAYIYTLNGTKEAFEGLNAEQQRNIILNRLIKQGLSEDIAKAILGNISDGDLDKFWDKDFTFTPSEMKDNETAEEYGKRYAEAWLKGLQDVDSDSASSAVDKITSSFDELSKSIDEVQSAYETVSSVMREYNETGIMTVDSLQSLLSLDNKYLAMLFDENGQLDLTSEALKRHSIELIRNMTLKKMADYVSYIDSLGVEAAEHLLNASAIQEETQSYEEYIKTLLMGSAVFGELSDGAQTKFANQLMWMVKVSEASIQD